MTIPKWLEGTLPKTIRIDDAVDPTDPRIEADPSQLNQALLNLCVNARDAMGEEGTLQLSTMRIAGNQLRGQFPRIEDRDYVCIAVKDTGPGMDETPESIYSTHCLRRNRKVREQVLGFPSFTAPS